MNSLRTIAIVGRPNVGKSALFNRLARRDIALVFDRPGTTRDRLVVDVRIGKQSATLMDTGGIGLGDAEGFGDAIAHEVDLALAAATDILFVVDGREGITLLDRDIAARLRRAGRPVHLVVNKLDQASLDNAAAEFSTLGFGEPIGISAAHGRGIEALIQKLTQNWPATDASISAKQRTKPFRLALVGRPNVGKSSLINAIVEESRAIVSDTPGTTRDAVDVLYEWKGNPYLLIDTAGMRPRGKVRDLLEAAMTSRSAHAINRAQLCILVLDATVGVQVQDKKVGGLIAQAGCPCVIAVNKWDLVEAQGDGGRARQQEWEAAIREDLFFLSHAPIIFTSAKTQKRVHALLGAAQSVAANARQVVPTGELNRVLARAMERNLPPQVKGRRFKIYYATQQQEVPSEPASFGGKKFKSRPQIPSFLLFVNEPALLVPAYRRYLELQLRAAFELSGCPIQLTLKERPRDPKRAHGAIGLAEKTRTQGKSAAGKSGEVRRWGRRRKLTSAAVARRRKI